MTVQARRITPAVIWTWARFEALSGGDVYDFLALRSEVFVVEQGCPFLDADGCDRDAWHLLGRIEAGCEANRDASGDPSSSRSAPLAAYLRCLDPGVKYQEPSIGRVIVAPSYRGTGLGRTLMREGIARTRAQWLGTDIMISAQLRLEGFYASLDFHGEGSPYIEDGIDHVEMRLTSTNTRLGEKQR